MVSNIKGLHSSQMDTPESFPNEHNCGMNNRSDKVGEKKEAKAPRKIIVGD